MTNNEVVLQIRCLKKTFQKGFWGTHVTALDGVDLTLSRGEVFVMTGVNGAGKSTTFRIVAGLMTPSSGEVRLFDRLASEPESRRQVGYLPDTPAFYDFLTSRESLTLCARLAGIPPRRIPSRIAELLDLVGLSHVKEGRLRTFSKGMLQRVALAQALIHDPALLLLDEPMSGLDPVGRADLCDILLDLKRQGKTILLSSHLLEDVEGLCDRVGVLAQGRIFSMSHRSVLGDLRVDRCPNDQEPCAV